MSTKKEQYRSVLGKYVPSYAVEMIVDLLVKHPVQFKISRPRKTKLGDFRANPGGLHRITVNGDLNQYSFLITTIHEFAHLVTFEAHGHRVKPHGKEWQLNYSKMIYPLIEMKLLPEDIHHALLNSLVNVKASSCTDQNLYRTLLKYDKANSDLIALEELSKNSIFALNGRVFIKGNLRRTRYVCECSDTNRKYLISALAQVKAIK